MALIAGFGLCLMFLVEMMLRGVLNLHAKIMLASSIFYISPVKESSMQKTAINIRLKHEHGTRLSLLAPSAVNWLCCRAKERMGLINEAEWKIENRLDLGKFLHEQKMTKLALQGLLS